MFVCIIQGGVLAHVVPDSRLGVCRRGAKPIQSIIMKSTCVVCDVKRLQSRFAQRAHIVYDACMIT